MAVLDPNGVPILALGEKTRERVAEAHARAIEKWEADDGETNPHLLVGEVVYVDNRRPVGNPEAKGAVTEFRIGAESLDEAAKSVVGAFEGFHGHDPPRWVSSTSPELADVLAEHWNCKSMRPIEGGARVAVGRDVESDASFKWVSAFSGTATTAPTATTFTTDSVNIPVNSVVGQLIVTTSGATRVGIIQSNTSAASSVLTIDRWYNVASLPGNRGVAAASTPTAGAWLIIPGNAPAAYMGLTANSGAAADGDTTLTGEITTAGGGLIRQLPTYAHTAAGTTTTLTQTFTCNGTDTLPVTVAKIGVFQGVEAASRMFFETLLNATMTFSLSGDQGQVTETVTL